ncbi:ATP-dependent DNA helicase PIF1-like [Solea solea]|uniref:ATP-dependent DNA helicase PIF1-like n=1 Tax=Solea solea TaxID=90069 RepID=UPI00272A5E6E|nr:ATP-dependent DNA helicase PIF1-like [Solea solea]
MAERQEAVADHQDHSPDLAVTGEQVQHLEKRNNVMCRSNGLLLVRSLNDTQMRVFYQIRQWCLNKVSGKHPPPLHVFITGGAGTGKSNLIKAIQYESIWLLSPLCSHPDNVSVLITAPTGFAAYNLNAATIHHTFSIGVDIHLPYTPLGEEKINSLRTKFSDLQMLIIEEISMVNHNLLAYIHGRLCQMKQSGNICVIAVGDFYQLPPVKGKPLYVEDFNIDLWSLFSVVQLTEVVRKKDTVFAELLNRVRTHRKKTPMLKSDVDILKHCETGEVSSALHIYATTQQVNEHNIQRLYDVCRDYVTIEAQDFQNNGRTGKLELIQGHHAKAKNTSLAEQLLLGEGARVMLCQNVDVSDGLVNGACGVITQIVQSEGVKFPKMVYVKFDDENVGAERRRQSPSVSAELVGSTAFAPEEERVCKKGGLRRQYPLKLAWACTIHKVQGITVDDVVVCFERIFAGGQAYVALSRVRSLSGLIIEQFDEDKIYCISIFS